MYSKQKRMMKTNKIYIAAATLALGLAACSEQADFTQADVVNKAMETADVPVRFDTYIGSKSTTRAEAADKVGDITTTGVNGTKSLQTLEFGVFGYQTSTDYDIASAATKANFMYNQEMTYTAGRWEYSPVKYWPNGTSEDDKLIDEANAANAPSNTAITTNTDRLSFFAYAPYYENGTTATGRSSLTTEEQAKVPTDVVKYFPVATTQKISAKDHGIVAMTDNSTAKNPYVKYVLLSAKSNEAVDLLWGLRGQKTYSEADGTDNTQATLGSVYNINLTKQIVGDKVRFLFKHALAKIGGNEKKSTTPAIDQKCGLKVVVDVDANGDNTTGASNQTSYFSNDFDREQTLVTIKSVSIQDGESATTSGYVTSKTSSLTNAGWFNLAKGEWANPQTVSTGGATYSVVADNDPSGTEYKLNPAIMEPKSDEANKPATAKVTDANKWSGVQNGTVAVTGVDKVTPVNVYAEDEDVPGLLLIPSGSENQTIYVTVDYLVRTADKKLESKYTEVEQQITNEINLSGLDPNKYYTILMHLGLTSVKFEAIVADWATTNTDEYDEDGNPIGGDVNNKSVWLPSNVVANNMSRSISASENITALDLSSYFTADKLGSYVSNTFDGKVSTVDASTISSVSITMTANTGTTKQDSHITFVGEKGKLILTITQDAGAITVSPSSTDNANGTATVALNAKEPDNSTAITSGYTLVVLDGSDNVVSTGYTDNADGTVTFTTAGTYKFKVTKDDSSVTSGAITVTITGA